MSEVIRRQSVNVDGWTAWDYHPDPTPDRAGNVWIWGDIKGWFGNLAVRASPIARPMSDGDYDGPSTFAGRTIELSGTLISPTRMALQQGMDEISRVLATKTRRALLTVDESQQGLVRTSTVRLGGPTLVTRTSATTADYSIVFYAPDPLRYSQTQYSIAMFPYAEGGGRTYDLVHDRVYGLTGATGRASCYNYGNAPTSPVISFGGPVDNPSMRVQGGDRVKLAMSIAAGDRAVVDCYARTVTLQSPAGSVGVNRRSYLTADSRWLVFDAGYTDVIYTADGGNGLANVAWWSAWS